MTWNYRIIRTESELALHEVYYDEGKIITWTADPIIIVDEDEGVAGILKSLNLMIKDIKRLKVIEEKDLSKPSFDATHDDT